MWISNSWASVCVECVWVNLWMCVSERDWAFCACPEIGPFRVYSCCIPSVPGINSGNCDLEQDKGFSWGEWELKVTSVTLDESQIWTFDTIPHQCQMSTGWYWSDPDCLGGFMVICFKISCVQFAYKSGSQYNLCSAHKICQLWSCIGLSILLHL